MAAMSGNWNPENLPCFVPYESTNVLHIVFRGIQLVIVNNELARSWRFRMTLRPLRETYS